MRHPPRIHVAFLLSAAVASSCTKNAGPELAPAGDLLVPEVPAGFPPLPLRADNPMTVASVQLGKALFFDERLSLGRGFSCGSCHRPQSAFSDSVPLSTGVHGMPGMRNAPSLANVAYHPLLNRDGGAPTLEQQVFVPLFDQAEIASDPQQVVEALRSDPQVAALSMRAYGRPFDLYVLTRSIANYERTLISGRSRYDRYLQGERNAMDPSEVRGMALFNGMAGCSSCHGGFDLSDHGFHNIGLTADDAVDPGRQRITLHPQDCGKFKTPSLRNIARTAPYMHDGSIATLQEVIAHFNAGGQNNPNKDPRMSPLHLNPDQMQDLAAFLDALNDEQPLDRIP